MSTGSTFMLWHNGNQHYNIAGFAVDIFRLVYYFYISRTKQKKYTRHFG